MSQQELIARAWALTEAIETAAADNDWPRAAELTNTRSPLLMGLQSDQPADAMFTIRRLQASIATIMNVATSAEITLMRNHRQALTQANAASRYQQAARF
ncbi:MAG: flagellar protein FliT [Pseudomonadota bacterium]|nr:flagellar protein FliT [Pseudomonadota bacterium]